MKKISFYTGLLLLSFCILSPAAEFHLYRNGKPVAVIEENSKCKRWILDFVRYSAACTETPMPVVKKAAPHQNRIVFNVQNREVEYDGFVIDFPDKRTMRISGTGTSVKSGIVHILEKYFGVRFLMRYPHWIKKRPAGYDMQSGCTA